MSAGSEIEVRIRARCMLEGAWAPPMYASSSACTSARPGGAATRLVPFWLRTAVSYLVAAGHGDSRGAVPARVCASSSAARRVDCRSYQRAHAAQTWACW